MATWIEEFHGATPGSLKSRTNAAKRWCPFVDTKCKKSRSGGACVLSAESNPSVIICPNRLYGNNFRVIREVAQEVFGANAEPLKPEEAADRFTNGAITGHEIIVYGQGFGSELGIAAPSQTGGRGGFFKMDYVLAKPSMSDLMPEAMVAIEVQSIDTTNSYAGVSQSFYDTAPGIPIETKEHLSTAGFNWENVNKRILPQVIYKGQALRRERLAKHGLYFILPDAVYQKIQTRLGGSLDALPQGPGTVTFKTYDLGAPDAEGTRSLEFVQRFTTSVDLIAYAFISPQNLPPLGAYEQALRGKIAKLI